MNAWELPTSLEIGGVGFSIRSDFRAILKILSCLSDPQYEPDEKQLIFLIIFYPNYKKIPSECYKEALEKAVDFIDMGMGEETKKRPTTMDWAKDSALIIPAVNRVLGQEVRALDYMHWWTFLGAYMEIGGECLFSNVLNIRQKRAKGQKLEKYELDFYRENKSIIDLGTEQKRSTEELNALREIFGFNRK